MKKFAVLIVAVGIIVAILVPQALAQSISLSVYSGLNLHPKGFITSIATGISVLKEIKNKPVSIGVGVNGGTYYSYSPIKEELKKMMDSPYMGLGAQTALFITAYNLPKLEGEGKFNHFFGPIAGVGIGPAYVNGGQLGGVAKVFLQGNYSFGEKGNFGVFAQAYLNMLWATHLDAYTMYAPTYAIYSPAIVAGCKFKIR